MLVAHVYGDGDFDCESLRLAAKPAILHIHTPNKHVGVAKNSIKTVKEQVQAQVHSLLYCRYLRVMVCRVVKRAGMILNYFPPSGNGGVSDNLCPAKVVDGVPKLDLSKKHI
eukprot:1376768-Ditylum_brightwellii.AAC.1